MSAPIPDLITTKEELFEKFQGQSEENIKAFVRQCLYDLDYKKNKLATKVKNAESELESYKSEFQRIDNFYECVNKISWFLFHPENGCPAGMSQEDFNELREAITNNN